MTVQRKNRLILVGLFLMFFLPVLLAVLLNSKFVDFKPASTRNYGQLIEPVVTLSQPIAGVDAQLAGKWWLIYADQGNCNESCQQQLATLHQLHLAAGKEFDRVGLMFVPTTPGNAGTLPPDVIAASGPMPPLDDALKSATGAADASRWLLLMDPLGNILMRYPPGFDASLVRKDLNILLKWSPLGKDS